MVKKTLLTLIAVTAMTTGAHASTLTFSALLNGGQEVGPNDSTAVGNGEVVVDTANESFDVSLLVVGLSTDDLFDTLVAAPVGPVHLHNAAAGVNGPIAVPFAFDDRYQDIPSTGTPLGFSLIAEDLGINDIGNGLDFSGFVAELTAGNIYFNVHTDAFNGGEIRGQLARVNEVPVPASGLLLAGAVAFGAWRARKKAA